jgi:hypothetical protein
MTGTLDEFTDEALVISGFAMDSIYWLTEAHVETANHQFAPHAAFIEASSGSFCIAER